MAETTHSEIALDLASRFLDCRSYGGVINFNSNCEPGQQCNYHINEDLESAEADAKRLAEALGAWFRASEERIDALEHNDDDHTEMWTPGCARCEVEHLHTMLFNDPALHKVTDAGD